MPTIDPGTRPATAPILARAEPGFTAQVEVSPRSSMLDAEDALRIGRIVRHGYPVAGRAEEAGSSRSLRRRRLRVF